MDRWKSLSLVLFLTLEVVSVSFRVLSLYNSVLIMCSHRGREQTIVSVQKKVFLHHSEKPPDPEAPANTLSSQNFTALTARTIQPIFHSAPFLSPPISLTLPRLYARVCNVCARRLFAHSSAEGGMLLSARFKSKFGACSMCKNHFVTSVSYNRVYNLVWCGN